MKKNPLKKLLTLRERLKKAAEADLALTEAAIASTEAHLQSFFVSAAERNCAAVDLQDAAYVRELAVGHLRGLATQADAQRELVVLAKREARQVEMLVDKRAKQAAEQLTRKQNATLDDWYRATTWEQR